MENFKTDTSGNSRDTSDTSTDASLPFGRKRCRWTRIRTCSPCQPRPNWAGQKCRPRRRATATRDASSTGCPRGGHGYEIFVTLLFQSGCRHLIDCSAVRPERRGDCGNGTFGQRFSSKHHGPRTETGCQTTRAGAARGCPRHRTPYRVPWDSANHRNPTGWGRVGIGEASQA